MASEGRARQALVGGTVAGIVGGIVIALFMAIVGAVRGEDLWVGTKIAAFPFLGDRVMAPGFDVAAVLLGLGSHFIVSIVWGVLFGFVAFGLPRLATLCFGATWGLVVWISMFYAVLPNVGATALARGTPVTMAILEHVIFGLAVSVGFLPYQRPIAQRRPAWRPAIPFGPLP